MRNEVLVEFTIEPFVEGAPGEHVTAAVAAVEAMGISVDFGPFGSTFVTTLETVGAAVGELTKVAYASGATHVSVHVERVES
ncbi:MAG: hypothetical protein NTU52_08095 [Actinobacteria bacterium]|jgi:uncharacterized protein YqgV (UPF0045/DUF77 family)|nr:hypothetical protein [Actinomycetota bacterium]